VSRAGSQARREARAALVREARALIASFEPRPASLRSTLKSIVIVGDSERGPVFCKKLWREDELWRWYFARELELHRRFAEAAPPLPCARLLAADPGARLLLLEALPGPPLTRLRRAEEPLAETTLERAVELAARLARWERGIALAPRDPPPPAARRAMRNRLLEDPSAPLDWVREGIARGVALGLCDEALAGAMLAALMRRPRVVFAHGDLLPRNLLQVAGGLTPVDWECAGTHPEGWDRALLWANLPAARPRIEATLEEEARAGFWACVGFALIRELKFRRERPGDRRIATLREELEQVREALG